MSHVPEFLLLFLGALEHSPSFKECFSRASELCYERIEFCYVREVYVGGGSNEEKRWHQSASPCYHVASLTCVYCLLSAPEFDNTGDSKPNILVIFKGEGRKILHSQAMQYKRAL